MTEERCVLLHWPNEAATVAWGRRLGQLLFPGAVVALTGPLGAGKTTLTRAIAEGLGIRDPTWVTSPTFVLLQHYPARLPIHHCDAYRLHSPEELWDIGIDEYLYGDGVCLIEWADRVASVLPTEHLHIAITPLSEGGRRASVHAQGGRYLEVLAHLHPSPL
jgi:tRNA threonylcarbamoyladenosine biosynthesis protein TsaE